MWKLLVVDDNNENRELLVEILRDVAQCTAVSSGKEAIEAFERSRKNGPFDLMLLDIEMPEIDGLEILRKIRDSEKAVGIPLGEGIPIIMVTAHKKPFLNAFYQGCSDYILKPIDADKLKKKIAEKLEKADQF